MKTRQVANCKCGHDKRDHGIPPMGTQGYGACKVCLCNRYAKAAAHLEAVAAKAGAER